MKKIIALFIIIGISALIADTLHQAGFFKTIKPHSEITDIKIYQNMAGTEDLELDKAKGLLFISSSDRWDTNNNGSSKDGIYLLDLNAVSDGVSKPIKLTTTYKGDFHPHGMSFISKDGADFLFVINHNQQGNFVELFQFKNNILLHKKSFQDQKMCCPNDLVAVDLDKFYVSNDHGAEKGLGRILEDYLRIANSYILYFNGEKYSKVYQNLNYANGVNVSADGKTVFVTETTGGKLSVLKRDIETGDLRLRFIKDLATGLDNITIDEQGNLWLATHPKLLDFTGHAKNTGKLSPSQVLKLTPIGDNDFQVNEVYLNKGEQLSGSSTALYYQGKVFVGVVFENKLLQGNY